MNKQKTIQTFIVLQIALCIIASTYSASYSILSNRYSFQGTAAITAINLGAYSDPACTNPLTRLDWGNVTPGSVNPQTIYLKNTGNIPETLSLACADWAPPEAMQYLSVSWNATAITLQPTNVIGATLDLTVAQSTGSLQNFTFTITITGTQT